MVRYPIAAVLVAAAHAVAGLTVPAGAGEPEKGKEMRVRVVQSPPAEGVSAAYVGNRPPLVPNPLLKLPIGAIVPQGWLRAVLELEAEGMFGKLGEVSQWAKPENNAWLDPKGAGQHGWEELPYWVKGLGDLGYVLGNERVIAEARRWIDGAIGSQRPDGYFGPEENRQKVDLWPNMPMVNALQSLHEWSGDPRVIAALTRYFRYELALPREKLLPGSWQKVRGGDNLQSVYWLYNRTGEAWLLDLARALHERTEPWAERVASWHGVNFCQGHKEPAIFYQQSGDRKHLEAAERNYRECMGLYGQVPGGLFGADENARAGYGDPRQGAEACSVAEQMLTDELLLSITGNPLYADRCEEIAFNTMPATMTPDLEGLHYVTSPNAVVLDAADHAPGIQNGGCMLAYSPDERYRCCQHNVAHAWPYYAEHLWMATRDDGLAAALYADCRVEAKVRGGGTVRIHEATDYPFSETVELTVGLDAPATFPLYLRVPRWCEMATVSVNGEALPLRPGPLTYLAIERAWSDGDRVKAEFPMRVTVRTWKANGDSVSVDRGPLTYSLRIGERWVKSGRPKWPDWEVFPTTAWNYGLVLDPKDPAASFKVEKSAGPLAAQPFVPAAAPIRLVGKAKKIPTWGLRLGLVDTLRPSPIKSAEPVEEVTLIPMGFARLRISQFPVIGEGPDAHDWPPAPPPPPPPNASHVNGGESVDAAFDGVFPKSSNDTSIPRVTWWDHKGTTEWIGRKLPAPRKVSRCEVYWFDDAPAGGCRVPASWRVLYRKGDEWVEVPGAKGYGVARDAWNVVAFDPVETTELRLEAKLQPNFSGGVLEWVIGDRAQL